MQVPQAVNYLATNTGRTRLLEIIFQQKSHFTVNELMNYMSEAQLTMDRSLVTTLLRVLVTKGLLLEWAQEDEVKRRGRKSSVFQVSPAARIAA